MSAIEDQQELAQLSDNRILTEEKLVVREAMLLGAGVPVELDE